MDSIDSLQKEFWMNVIMFIVITHIFSLLDYLSIDTTLVLSKGKIKKEDGPEIIEQIKKEGFESL